MIQEENYMEYVDKIIQKSINIINLRGKKTHVLDNDYYVYLLEDEGKYFSTLQYVKKLNDLWTMTTAEDFYNNYCDNKDLRFIEHSFRSYGQPKLDKPKELKGIKQSFTVDYIPKKCKCKIFIKDNDIWIMHRDYFSSEMEVTYEDMGMPLGAMCEKYLGKDKKCKSFIYPDAWGSIVLRNEAWLCIKNLIHRIKIDDFELDLVNEILRQQEKSLKFKDNELVCSDMERFWEKVIRECKKYK